MPKYKIRAVAFRRNDWWIVHCLEHHFVTQVRRLEDLAPELHRLLTLQIVACQQRGIEPFFGFSPAPRKYWEMYERAETRLMPAPGQQSSSEVGLACPDVETETRLAA